MLTDETLKALLEGIIYVAPEPVTLEGILKALEGEDRERVKAKLSELVADYEQNSHGIQIRQVANGYKFSSKAEHHETLRKYVKSLKPPVKLSKPALETLAVIAYRQPVTVPEIEEIRGVDSGGVIHTLLEKKLVVTSGRKNVVGRPALYRTSKDFLMHFGLKDVGELPSLKEFEELAKRALGSDWTGGEAPSASEGAVPGAESAAGDVAQQPAQGVLAPINVEIPPTESAAPAEPSPTPSSDSTPAAADATQESSAPIAEAESPTTNEETVSPSPEEPSSVNASEEPASVTAEAASEVPLEVPPAPNQETAKGRSTTPAAQPEEPTKLTTKEAESQESQGVAQVPMESTKDPQQSN